MPDEAFLTEEEVQDGTSPDGQQAKVRRERKSAGTAGDRDRNLKSQREREKRRGREWRLKQKIQQLKRKKWEETDGEVDIETET